MLNAIQTTPILFLSNVIFFILKDRWFLFVLVYSAHQHLALFIYFRFRLNCLMEDLGGNFHFIFIFCV